MDYFNEKERRAQVEFASKRDGFFSPIINGLTRLGVKPNHVTVLGVIFLVMGCLMPTSNYVLASVFLILYLVMDGIDGGLARKQKINHQGGSILDIWADQMGVILVPAAAIYHMQVDGVSAVLFSNFYVLFIVLTIFINQLDIKMATFIRVKYPLYVIYVLSMIFGGYLIYWFMLIFSVYYGISILYCLNKLYQHYDAAAH